MKPNKAGCAGNENFLVHRSMRPRVDEPWSRKSLDK
jgi:hypothetical protein